ncbi:hypothetical protein ZIOFF_004333 [Zingiber officinale]|uniref:PTEN2A/B C2 domain-containing protein n=1 Tax=Zingiber officinale TaxID=94328 RepID=A0A8J5IP22_ZINOF|nr:hypothetical protein ZIOFF_004333 [Zingiber officinale]
MGCVSSGGDKMEIPSPLEAHQNLLVTMALCSRWPLSFLPAIDRGTPMDPDQALRTIRIHRRVCSSAVDRVDNEVMYHEVLLDALHRRCQRTKERDYGLTEVVGDFKIHFLDRHGDLFIGEENRKFLNASDLDGFDKCMLKLPYDEIECSAPGPNLLAFENLFIPTFILQRKLPYPEFQIEVVLVDYDGANPNPPRQTDSNIKESPDGTTSATKTKIAGDSKSQDKDNSFSDSEEEGSSRGRRQKMGDDDTHVESPVLESTVTGFKAIAADASVFSFGDDEHFESEWHS